MNCFHFFYRNLKNTLVSDIIKTVSQHKLKLMQVFKANVHIPDRHINPSFGINFLIILDSLVTRDQQIQMYRTIRDEITDIDADKTIRNVNGFESFSFVWFTSVLKYQFLFLA